MSNRASRWVDAPFFSLPPHPVWRGLGQACPGSTHAASSKAGWNGKGSEILVQSAGGVGGGGLSLVPRVTTPLAHP